MWVGFGEVWFVGMFGGEVFGDLEQDFGLVFGEGRRAHAQAPRPQPRDLGRTGRRRLLNRRCGQAVRTIAGTVRS